MLSISEHLALVEPASPRTFKNLTIFPLFRSAPAKQDPGYLLLEDAIAQGLARITETGGGSIPELRLDNDADCPVLLLDGEELLGAKQDRALSLTVLAPSKRATVIPVSCVEPGRWRMAASEFRVSGDVMYSRARAARTMAVTASMRKSGTHGSDQSKVWDELAAKASRLGVESPTGAMAAMYEQQALLIEERSRAFAWTDGQTGVLCALGCCPLAMDLFDHPATMRRLFPKLVRSYALDALDAEGAGPGRADSSAVAELLRDAANATAFTQPAVGIGKNVRFLGKSASGSALWAGGRYVHICAFGTNGAPDGARFHTRMSRPTYRRGFCAGSRRGGLPWLKMRRR